jgi:predicted  nucleic acid-binding Zn-ribbon protein
MRKCMATLLALQSLELGGRKAGKDAERGRLRAEIPEPVLGHFDRLLARGKKGVSVIRNGVCTECHLRVPIGTLVTLARGADIQLCGNCGRYLHLPDEELPFLKTAEKPAVVKPAASRPRRRRGSELTVA